MNFRIAKLSKFSKYLAYSFFFLSFHLPQLLTSQTTDTSFQLLHSIPEQSTFITTDNLQNLYVANEKGQVLKYDKTGRKKFEYNNNRLGEVGKIDVRNPLTILVYYPELAVIVLLDRTLSEMRQINLWDLGFIDPQLVALANDNNIWVYDGVNAMLKKINQEGEVLFESRNLNQLVQKELNPSYLLEANNLIYLSDSNQGVFVFDTFGQLKQKIYVKGVSRFQVIQGQIVYQKENQIFIYYMTLSEQKKIGLPFNLSKKNKVLLQGRQMYFVSKDRIDVYVVRK